MLRVCVDAVDGGKRECGQALIARVVALLCVAAAAVSPVVMWRALCRSRVG